MDLNVSYLGLKLKNPIVVGSSTFTGTVEGIVNCAKAGAGAVVLKSLFEEQILSDIKKEEGYTDIYTHNVDADLYMKTFNCADKGEWTSFAKELQDAGADALELNISVSPFDKDIASKDLEDEVVSIFNEVKKTVTIPVSVKLGNHFTNIGNIAFRLSMAGAAGLVLFNRFYNPTIDIENMKVVPGSALSVEEENGSTLRWISLLAAQEIPCSLSASTGVHSADDVVRQILAGASSVQVCSVLYKKGIDFVANMLEGMEKWMQKHNFNSIIDFKGKCSASADVKVFERLQYLRRNNDLN